MNEHEVSNNIFTKGCLIQLSISQWGANKKLDRNRIAQMTSSPEWVRATKKLVEPESLKPIAKVSNAARNYLDSISLPFPLHGMCFIPKDLVSQVDAKLDEFLGDFHDQVERFVSDYPELRRAAVVYLGELFSEMDYPVNVRHKFSFAWRFITLDVPNGRAGILSPELYEREKQKFVNTMEEAREVAVQALREEFSALVSRICERFTTGPDGQPKIFKNATVSSFYEYFETFKQRNIFADADLAELVTRAQSILNGDNPDQIRTDSALRSRIATDMGQVEKALAEVMTRPRRKIILPTDPGGDV